MEPTSAAEFAGWTRDFTFRPSVVVRPQSIDDVVKIVNDHQRYPSPVRAIGSNHSVAPSADPDQGTILEMSGMNRVLEIGADYVRAEAGALYIDVAKELERHNLQFHVNTEIGNLSMGAAAFAQTKDSSLPGEYGQISSYLKALKMVTASGEIVEYSSDDEPELMRALRCSFGLLGIVCEVTFRVKPLEQIAIWHKTYTVDGFADALPRLAEQDESLMLYINPFIDSVVVEHLRYSGDTKSPARFMWAVKRFMSRWVIGGLPRLIDTIVPWPGVRRIAGETFGRMMNYSFRYTMQASNSMPAEQMVRYPERSGAGRFTFSLWAFPLEQYPATLRAYRDFVRRYDSEHGYRHNVATVAYVVAQDTNSLFSYSNYGRVATLDPVSTGGPEWERFLDAFNEFCSEHGGSPTFNQTPRLTPMQVQRALGDRLDEFNRHRARFDPANRFLNGYFERLLGIAAIPEKAAAADDD